MKAILKIKKQGTIYKAAAVEDRNTEIFRNMYEVEKVEYVAEKILCFISKMVRMNEKKDYRLKSKIVSDSYKSINCHLTWYKPV